MGWQLGFLAATSDLEITQEEITGLVSGVVGVAVRGMVIVGMMTMFIKGFYGILGEKKYAKKKEEMLEEVREVFG